MVGRVRVLAIAAVIVAAGAFNWGTVGCYGGGSGDTPLPGAIYFPVGMAVSRHGHVLYVANSDFDLQYNGGTLQSYDLDLIRTHAAIAIHDPTDSRLPLVIPNVNAAAVGVVVSDASVPASCPQSGGRRPNDATNTVQPPGFTCAPPVLPSLYLRDEAIIGAFATDVKILTAHDSQGNPNAMGATAQGGTALSPFSRLFVPIRGDASLTFADVVVDDATPPAFDPTKKVQDPYPPFFIGCGRSSATGDNRCGQDHGVGPNANAHGDSRNLTLPGEPFGLAFSDDGLYAVLSHQNDQTASLLFTGLPDVTGKLPIGTATDSTNLTAPSLQFIASGLPGGGVALASIPHDPDAFPACKGASAGCLPNPAFLEVSRASSLVSLVRTYPDDVVCHPFEGGLLSDTGSCTGSSLLRPFIQLENSFSLSTNAGGTDNRGIVIDTTARIRCKASPGTDPTQCAQRNPATAFITDRSPPSLIVASVGDSGAGSANFYNADSFQPIAAIPLPSGPSRVHLAPVIDPSGNYALKVFVVCFDSNELVIIDPVTLQIEKELAMGRGPYAFATDPFDYTDAALGKPAPTPSNPTDVVFYDLRSYRFGYVASFTDSFIQVIDLDEGQPETFGTVVLRLGYPTPPKGS